MIRDWWTVKDWPIHLNRNPTFDWILAEYIASWNDHLAKSEKYQLIPKVLLDREACSFEYKFRFSFPRSRLWIIRRIALESMILFHQVD